MNAFMIQVLRGSGFMTVIALVYLLAVWSLQTKYRAKTLYQSGLLILIGFIIPFRPDIVIPMSPETMVTGIEAEHTFLQRLFIRNENKILQDEMVGLIAGKSSFPLWKGIFMIWMAGVATVLLYYIAKHIYFTKTVRRWSKEVTQQQTLIIWDEVKRKWDITYYVELRECACISSPMLVMLKHPVILLPNIYLSENELKAILSHEIVHLKRYDLLCKAALLLAVAMNWFNPIIYLFVKMIAYLCECSCDEAVTETMNQDDKYEYAATIVRMSCAKSKKDTALSAFFFGGKKDMKKRVEFIMDISKKRKGSILLIVCFLLTLCTGVVFASPKYDKELEREIQQAFSETFSNEFDENEFEGMIISYDENGVPIVTDPGNKPLSKGVQAVTRYAKNGFYSASSCSSSDLVFYILKDQTVEVIDSAYTTTVAKVKYAGATGYMKKDELRF